MYGVCVWRGGEEPEEKFVVFEHDPNNREGISPLSE